MKELLSRYPILAPSADTIRAAEEALVSCFRAGGKLLLCGNGGSAADCEHISGELCKAFLEKRPIPEEKRAEMTARCPEVLPLLDGLEYALPAIPLPSMSALFTAYSNDRTAELAFAQGVLALGRPGDVLIAISTSGNSANILAAARVARALEITVIALTGEGGGALREAADVTVAVPERETFRVQELHLPVYHYLCAAVERAIF